VAKIRWIYSIGLPLHFNTMLANCNAKWPARLYSQLARTDSKQTNADSHRHAAWI